MLIEFRKISGKLKIVLLLVFVIFGVIAVGAYSTYDYIEHNPEFCQSCHTMKEPYQKWRESPHHMVNCHECHKQSKIESLHQAWMYLTQRPDEVVHHPELDHKVCAQCHLSQDTQWKLIAETAGHKVHFGKAEIECLDCHMKGIHEFFRPVDACVECHSDKPGNIGKMGFVHCLQCHNFLGKEEKSLIPTAEVCRSCHEKIQTDKPHTSMSKGDCIKCHQPHHLKEGAP